VQACAVCRTDLHLLDGDLDLPLLPIVPGHEIVGVVDKVGSGTSLAVGARVGVTWLGHTCGRCRYCDVGQENLCNEPVFTGHGRDGGFATHVLADAAFCVALPQAPAAVSLAPLLCAGAIAWRALRLCGDDVRHLGLFGFGAAAHLLTQVAVRQGREVHAFTRPGDSKGQRFARSLGAAWAGDSDEPPPAPLDAAIIFAPVGSLVPLALKSVRKGGRVVCAGIHMSDLPAMPYRLLWEERQVLSVANLTRDDALQLLQFHARHPIQAVTHTYPLARANQALADLRDGRFEGVAVLVP